MKLDKCHVQYHPEYDDIFVTHIPETVGAKATNLGHAVDRTGEFFYACYLWAWKVAGTPPVLSWIQEKVPVLRPKTTPPVSRTWTHPDGLMEITITVKILK